MKKAIVQPKAAGSKRHLSFPEKYFIQELYKAGFKISTIQELLYSQFKCYLTERGIEKVVYEWDATDAKLDAEYKDWYIKVAKDKVKQISTKTAEAFLDGIARIAEIRKMAEMKLGDSVATGSMRDGDLIKLTKDLFERERILAGLPTAITKDLSKASDDELLKEAYDTNPEVFRSIVSEFIDRKPKGDIEGIGQTTQGGADPLLEAPQQTTPVHQEP